MNFEKDRSDFLHRACSGLSVVSNQFIASRDRKVLLMYSAGSGIRRADISIGDNGRRTFLFSRPLNCGDDAIKAISFDSTNYPLFHTPDHAIKGIDELCPSSVEVVSSYVVDLLSSLATESRNH